jgi:translation elongation factor P/translation initiation factor 5A
VFGVNEVLWRVAWVRSFGKSNSDRGTLVNLTAPLPNQLSGRWGRCPPVILKAFDQLLNGKPKTDFSGIFHRGLCSEEIVAALIDAIDVKRKMFFEVENTPFLCLEAEVSTPTARGAQTLVRLKMRNLLTRAVFDKTFKASDRFKEPDLQMVQASYLYSDGDGVHFMDQESFETLTLSGEMIRDSLDFMRWVHYDSSNP